MTVVIIAVSLAVSAAAGFYAWKHPAFGLWWFGFATLGCVALVAANAGWRNWWFAALFAALTPLNAWNWHDCRRKAAR